MLYEIIYEKAPWTLDNVTSFDELYTKVILEKARPTLIKSEGILII
jgi:hypothetical protein